MKQIARTRWHWEWDGGAMVLGIRSFVDRVEFNVLPFLRLTFLRDLPVERPAAPVPIEGDSWLEESPAGERSPEPPPALWFVTIVYYAVPMPSAPGPEPRTFHAWSEPALTPDGTWLAWIDGDGSRNRTDLSYVEAVSWVPKD